MAAVISIPLGKTKAFTSSRWELVHWSKVKMVRFKVTTPSLGKGYDTHFGYIILKH